MMDKYMAMEQAYKNGYENGRKDGIVELANLLNDKCAFSKEYLDNLVEEILHNKLI